MTDTTSDDELIPLAEAARIFFSGRLTKSSLRTEAAKGRLEIFRIANKDFVTRDGIRRMVERCRVKESPPVSTSGPTPEPGSSRMDQSVSAQDALTARLNARSKPCAPMSPKNTSPSAAVVPLRSQSATS